MMNRKQEILDIAGELLQTRSYSSFSYQDISDRLNITKAAIHSHYRTKEALGIALVDRYIAQLTATLETISVNHSKPWQQFDAFVDNMYQNSLAADKICPVGSLQSEFSVIPDSIKERVSRLHGVLAQWMTNVLSAGRESGTMTFAGAPEDQAIMVMATLQGVIQNARSDGKEIFFRVMDHIRNSMVSRG